MTLTQLNSLDKVSLQKVLGSCCGAGKWVDEMALIFPVPDQKTLLQEAERIWYQCNGSDWKEAFAQHPKIGDIKTLEQKFAPVDNWAEGEQAGVKQTSAPVLEALAEGNQMYERRFGYIFIVCATGKSAEEMLALLQARLPNEPQAEISIAMEEQNKITQIRLQKLLTT